jgi:hypothetical protein
METDSLAEAGLVGNVALLHNSYVQFGRSADSLRAYSFYCSGTPRLVAFNLRKVGSPADNVVVQIRSNGGIVGGEDAPSSTVLASTTLAGTSLGTTGATYNFAPNIALAATTKYWLVFSRSGATNESSYYECGQAAPTELSGFRGRLFTAGAWATGTDTQPTLTIWIEQGFSKISVLQFFVCHGEAINTGTKTGELTATDPSIATSVFEFGDNMGATDIYPATWRWHRGGTAYDTPHYYISRKLTFSVAKTDGTSRVALLGFAGTYLEYTNPDSGWNEYQKISDSSFWWAKQAQVTTEHYQPDDTSLVINAGDYAITPDPISDADMKASIDQATLQANYTKV